MKKTGLGIITLIAAMILSATVFILVILGMWGVFSRPEITTDISKYEALRSGPNAEEDYQDKLGMDESIWPEKMRRSL